MNRFFWKRALTACWSLTAFGVVTFAISRVALQQSNEAHTVYLWDGTGATDARVSVGVQGNGSAKAKKGVDYASRSALDVTTRNFYEGARFNVTPPLDLAPYRQNGSLRLRLRSESNAKLAALPFNAAAGRPGFPGAPGGFPSAFNPGGFSPGGLPGGFSPGGAPTTAPGVYNPVPFATATPTPDPSQQLAPIAQIQVVMHLEKGALFGQFAFGPGTEANVRPDQFGWQSFALRWSSLRATPNASGALRSIVLSGNSEGTFQVGQLALAPGGSTAISIRRATDAPGTQQTEIKIAPQTPLNLVADVETGDVDSQVEWNFDADKTGSLPAANPEQPLNGSSDGSVSRTSGRPGDGGFPGGNPGGFPGAGGSGFGAPSNNAFNPGPPGSGADVIALNAPRLDARGLATQFSFPDEEQDYRVEVTVRDRITRRELGKASLVVHVRSEN